MVHVIEQTPAPQVINAIEPLKSTFLKAVVPAARMGAGKAASLV